MLLNSMARKTVTTLSLALFLSAAISTAHAKKDRKGSPRGKPPAEAFSACESLTEKSSCSFNTPNGKTIQGSCVMPRKAEEALVCKPKRGKRKDKNNMKTN